MDVSAFTSSPVVELVGRAIWHSAWEGLVITAMLTVVLRGMRGGSPRARYAIACLAMVLMVAVPIMTVGLPLAEVRVDRRIGVLIAEDSSRGPGLHHVVTPTIIDRFRPIWPATVAAWVAGVVVMGTRLLGGWTRAGHWRRRESRSIDWKGFDRLKRRMGVDRAVALLESSMMEVPTVIGWLRPAILVPTSALSGLTPEELDAILSHELAHIARHDYLVNMMQCVVETLLFYHPCVWLVSRWVRQEREHCCDDLAVSACGDCLTYARALASMEGLRSPSIALFPAANGGNLLARVARVLEPTEESMKPIRMLTSVAMALMVVVVPAWLARGAGDPPKQEPDMTVALRSYRDIVVNVDETPTGRLMVGMGKVDEKAEVKAVPILDGGDQAACLDPPSEAEVLDKLPKPKENAHRDNIRVLVEKIGDKVDPAKVYPLAGVCQLVHCHYKASVFFDETTSTDSPIYSLTRKQRVEVVFIDKDHLRRAPEADKPDRISEEKYDQLNRRLHLQIQQKRHADAVDPAGRPVGVEKPVEDIDRKIDRLSREVEDLKRLRDRDREQRKQTLDRLGKDLDDLKREVEAGPKTGLQDNLDDNAYELARKYFSQTQPKRPALDQSRFFPFFLGAFW